MAKSSPQPLNLDSILQNINTEPKKMSVGTVQAFGDGVIFADGLDDLQAGELVDLGQNQFGLTLNLDKEKVGIVSLSNQRTLKAGDKIYRTGRILSLGVGDEIIGRAINAVGQSVDGRP